MNYHIYDGTKWTNKTSDDANNKWLDIRDFYTFDAVTNDDIVVKELVNSDDFLRMILKKFNSTKKFLSHCFYMEPKNNNSGNTDGFIVTDAALNQFPNLSERVKIAQNAINFCKRTNVLNIAKPLVTFLNHSGHFNIKNPTACDSHLLVTECERLMQDLADFSDYQLDCCLSQMARDIKHIDINRNSNIIVANDINEGNSIVKSFLLNGWAGYGYLTGLDIRVVLNSRANLDDNPRGIAKITQ